VANPPEGMEPAFAAQFLQIRQTFMAGLAQRLHDIQHATHAQARHMALHRLAGAAGGYGFPELSLLAQEAMDAESGANELLQAALQRLAQAIEEIPLGS
jgi:Hpt domain